jgi:hypothetical protein
MIIINNIEDLKKHHIAKKNGVSGIYLWGVKHRNRYIPLNVGKGNNIHERIFQHLSRWRGGEYRVPKWEIIIGKEKQLNPFTTDEKLLYIPHGAHKYSDFLKNEEINKSIKNVVDNFFCILYPIENSNLYDDEDSLATLVGKGILISSHRKKDTQPTKYAQDVFDKLKEINNKICP